MDENKEYYLATKDEEGNTWTYESETFRLSEIDLITLIKICLIEQRSKSVGKRLLAVYKDSTTHRIHITKDRLERIGVKDEQPSEPTKRKTKSR